MHWGRCIRWLCHVGDALPTIGCVKRSAPIKRTGRLNYRSKKRAALYKDERIPIVIAMLEAKPICERCKVAKSSDIHELKSRARGGSITDPKNLSALCRPCHSWITTHPADATAEGWLRNSWD